MLRLSARYLVRIICRFEELELIKIEALAKKKLDYELDGDVYNLVEAPTKEVPKKIHTIPYKKIGYKLPSIK